MLIILLVFALFRTLRGVPLSSAIDDSDGFPALDFCDKQSHSTERAISDMILSCVTTIFACTWSAVHPNIPAPTDCAWTHFKRQVVTMVYALLAPEAITAWALRQRLAARIIVNWYNNNIATYKNPEVSKSTSVLDTMRAIFYDSPLPSKLKDGQVPEWTLAHGFFLQMGGFMLSDGGRPIQSLGATLAPDDYQAAAIEWNIRGGCIDPPLITEEDIQDRSKGDTISKTLIILQTTWFIVQCIARWSNRLPVTELEVVTLGFAMLNAITYGLWWNKPQNVGRPVFLEIKCKQQGPTENSNPQTMAASEDSEMQSLENNGTEGISNPSGDFEMWHEDDAYRATPIAESYLRLRRKIQEDIKQHVYDKPWKLIYLIPLYLIQGLIRPLAKLSEFIRLFAEDSGDLRVPMFYSEDADNSQVYGITTFVGVLFGSIHLITSWLLDFASVYEMWLWRVSAIVITVGPIFIGLLQYSIARDWYRTRDYTRYYYKIFKACLIGVVTLYIISRIILLILALTSLRALSPAALQTVDWTTFIPHI